MNLSFVILAAAIQPVHHPLLSLRKPEVEPVVTAGVHKLHPNPQVRLLDDAP